jgi:deazaflavin-dependent oxidoreductase (nitroreductase family)
VQRMAASPWFARVGPKIAPKVDRTVHRLTGGRYTVSQFMLPVVVLTTTGAKSGLPRTVPLAAVPVDGDLVVVGSNFGQTHHPAWSANLIAHPRAQVSIGGDEYDVDAVLLDAEALEEVWPRLTEIWPLFDRYAETSGRTLRVFRLPRAG